MRFAYGPEGQKKDETNVEFPLSLDLSFMDYFNVDDIEDA